MPLSTNPYFTAAQAGLYGTPTINFSSAANAGRASTTGIGGGLASLYGYSTPNYTPTAIYTDSKTPATGKLADAMSTLYAQERQAGINRNAAREQTILQGYEQRIGNNRSLYDTTSAAEDASMNAVSDAALDTRTRGLNRIDQLMGENGYEALKLERDRVAANAKAKQSAIKRGLANTTITNSLERGVDADYQLNRLALRDRQLQNALQTDSALSAQYQNALAATAGAQRSRNSEFINREGTLTGDRLGFLSSIQDEYPTLTDVYELYKLSGRPVPTGA